jgi:hypothetical protein
MTNATLTALLTLARPAIAVTLLTLLTALLLAWCVCAALCLPLWLLLPLSACMGITYAYPAFEVIKWAWLRD